MIAAFHNIMFWLYHIHWRFGKRPESEHPGRKVDVATMPFEEMADTCDITSLHGGPLEKDFERNVLGTSCLGRSLAIYLTGAYASAKGVFWISFCSHTITRYVHYSFSLLYHGSWSLASRVPC